MRALVAAAHRYQRGTVLVLAPTGKAVDVAVRESALTNSFRCSRNCTRSGV